MSRLFLLLLLNLGVAFGAPDFVLGLDYSQWLPSNAKQITTDSSGAIYVLSAFPYAAITPPSTVTKISADGWKILWQLKLDTPVSAMAVTPDGSVFVTPFVRGGSTSVSKLASDGSGIAWTQDVGIKPANPSLPILAADGQERAYVSAWTGDEAQVVRLKADGTGVDYRTTFQGTPSSIAVDGIGAAYVTGTTTTGLFLTRFAPNGLVGFYSTIPSPPATASLALDPNGSIVVYSSGVLRRFDAYGTLLFSKTVATWKTFYPGLALDADGNAYIMGSSFNSSNSVYPVKNTLAPCDTDMLSVVARDGSILQTTYIPGASKVGSLVATGHDGSVFVVSAPVFEYNPTRAGPFPSGGLTNGANFIVRLAPNVKADTLPLACVGSASSFQIGGVVPGALLTLMGSGLGPEQGVNGVATMDTPFPKQLANVEVRINGSPVPLLYVQDRQINLAMPFIINGTAEICPFYNNVKGNCIKILIGGESPGLFTIDGVYAAALNQDGSVNSETNPAAPGSLVSLFGSGFGQVTPRPIEGSVTGFPLPLLVARVTAAVRVMIRFPGGGIDARATEVTYAGPAPFLAAGVTQINLRVGESGQALQVLLPGSGTQSVQVYIRR